MDPRYRQDRTHVFISGYPIIVGTVRRGVYVGMVVFVAAAFGLATWTRGTGLIFLVSMVAAAGVLIAVVFLIAIVGGRDPRPGSRVDAFVAFEEAARHAKKGGLYASPGDEELDGFAREPLLDSGSRSSAKAFVRTLVPVPIPPGPLATVSARTELLEALRKEGAGLIQLAKVTGADASPYRSFLADARKAALRGDTDATVRSLQLGNELLRAAIEKFLIKRKRLAQESPELAEW
jgi:hypothetical protein